MDQNKRFEFFWHKFPMQIDFHALPWLAKPCKASYCRVPTNKEIKSSHFGPNKKQWTENFGIILEKKTNKKDCKKCWLSPRIFFSRFKPSDLNVSKSLFNVLIRAFPDSKTLCNPWTKEEQRDWVQKLQTTDLVRLFWLQAGYNYKQALLNTLKCNFDVMLWRFS